jgi:DNA-binding transcriptional LysR family regulator
MVVEIRLMRYVVAVAEEGGFQRGASRLRMAQPPLSRQIRNLERELGVVLFERRPTRLTEPGRVFVEAARRILAEVDSMVEQTVRAGHGVSGLVKLGHAPAAAHGILASLLAAVHEQHPAIQLEVHERWAPAGDPLLDLALTHYAPRHPDLASLTLRHEPFVVLMSARHPLAAAPSLGWIDLRGMTLCALPQRLAPTYRSALEAAVRAAGEIFDVRETPLPAWRLPLLLDSSHFTLAPEPVGRHLFPGLAAVPFPALPPAALDLVWRPDRVAPAAMTCVELARDLGRSASGQ